MNAIQTMPLKNSRNRHTREVSKQLNKTKYISYLTWVDLYLQWHQMHPRNSNHFCQVFKQTDCSVWIRNLAFLQLGKVYKSSHYECLFPVYSPRVRGTSNVQVSLFCIRTDAAINAKPTWPSHRTQTGACARGRRGAGSIPSTTITDGKGEGAG